MQTGADCQDRDREATSRRFSLAVFVAAELLSTGALVAGVVVWM
jgi:hypothetical protein